MTFFRLSSGAKHRSKLCIEPKLYPWTVAIEHRQSYAVRTCWLNAFQASRSKRG